MPRRSWFRRASDPTPAEPAEVAPVVKAEALAVGGLRTPDPIEQSLQDSGMNTTADMGPGRPLQPYRGYSQRPRAMDYPVGVNISTATRAAWGRASFNTLKAIIDSYDVARMCINHKIDELRSMEPMFLPADGVRGDVDAAIDAAKAALAFPDRELPYDSWLHKWLESVMRYDAGTLYRRRNREGDVIGLEAVDGATIAPYIDEHGRRPAPPSPAYYQLIHGQLWNWFTSQDIIYTPFRPQADSPYGLAPMESVLLTANTDLRFQWWFLQQFTEGSIPAAYGELPPDRSNPDQVAEWQDYWDAVIEGDQAQQHKVKWVPAGTKITAIQNHEFTSDFPEYLMSRTAAMHGVLPQDLGLVRDVNRANGETQTDIQFRVNTLPWVRFAQGVLTRYVQLDLGLPVKIQLDTGRDKEDRLAEAQAWGIYIDKGMASADEGRSKLLGLPIDNERPTPRFYNNAKMGPIPLLAIEAVAGKTDVETYGPAADQPVMVGPYVAPTGVVPQAGTTAAKASLAATDAAQQQEQAVAAAAQPAAELAPAVKAAASEGVTTETGLNGIDLVTAEEQPAGEDEDEAPEMEAARKEIAAFGRFTKTRQRAGKWRPFDFSAAVDPVIAHRLNDVGRAAVRKAAGELIAAGLCVQAVDSGRVLMIQRGVDPLDPASGMWEFPGGHIEDGESPFGAACREWQEETGCLLPADILVNSSPELTSWASANGIYAGYVLPLPDESYVNIAGRGQVTNPDDPDGDQLEAIAWWEPEMAAGNPLIRAELAADMQLVLAALGQGEPPVVAEVVKASDAGPKAPSWRDGTPKTPQHAFDLRLTDHYGPKITAALQAMLPAGKLRAAIEAAGSVVVKSVDPGLDTLRSAARDSLASATNTSELEQQLRELMAEAFQTGAFAASQQLGDGAVTLAGVSSIDWARWEPGDAAAAALVSNGGLADLLATADTSIRGIADTTLDRLGNAIGDGLSNGQSIDTIAASLPGIIDDPVRAEMIAHTETARAQTVASLATYAANGVGEWDWILSDDACDECVAAAENGPYRVGDGGAPAVPLHPRCRCSSSPRADSVTVDGRNDGSMLGADLADLIDATSIDEAASAAADALAGDAAAESAGSIAETDLASTAEPAEAASDGAYEYLNSLSPARQWSAEQRDQILDAFRASGDEGKTLADTLERFQDGGSIARLRGKIEKYVNGEEVDATSEARARALINAIRNAPTDWAPDTAYRGMSVKGSLETVLKKYEVGQDLDLNITSFSSDRSVAVRFQSMTEAKGTTKVMVELVGPDKKLLPIQNLPKDRRLFKEKEWVGGGKYRVVEVKKAPGGGVLMRIEQVGTL